MITQNANIALMGTPILGLSQVYSMRSVLLVGRLHLEPFSWQPHLKVIGRDVSWLAKHTRKNSSILAQDSRKIANMPEGRSVNLSQQGKHGL